VVRDGEQFFPVYHLRDAKQLLGYIRFSFDKKNLRVCEFTNFQSSLQRRHLGIGGTVKADDSHQIGQHGEGLKLSARVNCRHPHNCGFVVVSSGCRWTFGWNIDKKLNCRIQRIAKAKLREQQELAVRADERKASREANYRAWEDVTVIIGEPHRCRSYTGEMHISSKIPLSDFESWTKMTIDINRPKEVVQTEHGDLILDPTFKKQATSSWSGIAWWKQIRQAICVRLQPSRCNFRPRS
jgi:hypothetical protein